MAWEAIERIFLTLNYFMVSLLSATSGQTVRRPGVNHVVSAWAEHGSQARRFEDFSVHLYYLGARVLNIHIYPYYELTTS
jgi:hypothetical protein